MIDPRIGTLGLCALLAGFAGLASIRSRRFDSTLDLGSAPRMFELQVTSAGVRRTLRSPRAVLVGRAPSVEIRVDEATVSRLHARIDLRDDCVYVADLGSRNGTLVNGKPVVREALLEPGDRVRVGTTEIVLVGVGEWK